MEARQSEEEDPDAEADMAFEAEQKEAYESDFEYEDDENPEDDYAYHRGSENEPQEYVEDQPSSDDEPYEDEQYEEEYDDRYDDEYDDQYEDDQYDEEYDDEQYDEVDNQDKKPSLAQRVLSIFRRKKDKADEAESDNYEDDYYLEDESELQDDVYDEDERDVERSEAAEYEPEPQQQDAPTQLPDPNRLHFDREQDDDILPRDDSGLDTISDSYDLYSGEVRRESRRERPAAVEDPNWGTSSYQPTRPAMNIARRAVLYDLPDPSGSSVDPLQDDYEYEEEVVSTRDEASRQSEPRSGFWHDDSSKREQSSEWKGGAAIRDDLRDEMPYGDGDLQDAMLEMGDEFLDEHDIWFVATGASEDGHAGIKAFLDAHRRDIRGAYLVNLECVGAGSLAVYAREGLYDRRRSDRRLVRLLGDIARDLHIPFDTAMCDWGETDATPALRARVRAVTIVGLDGNDQPAYSHTIDDVPENVNPGQVEDVVRIVTEVIRRG